MCISICEENGDEVKENTDIRQTWAEVTLMTDTISRHWTNGFRHTNSPSTMYWMVCSVYTPIQTQIHLIRIRVMGDGFLKCVNLSVLPKLNIFSTIIYKRLRKVSFVYAFINRRILDFLNFFVTRSISYKTP